MTSVRSHAVYAVVDKFPRLFNFVFAYGSGVLPQSSGSVTEKKMIDLIFVVDDALAFHKENMKCNPSHYSLAMYGGANFIREMQEGFGAKIYFNTHVQIEDELIKYGVITTNHLIEDLLDWQTLYVSGRLHKPIQVIQKPETNDLKRALNINLQSALHASLLCLPETFTEEQLFHKIAGLSYSGDFRMYFGEDKKKIENIVINQMSHFRTLYEDPLKIMPFLYWERSQGVIEQDCSYKTTLHHLNLLPKQVQHNILVSWSKAGHYRDIEDVLQALAWDNDCSEIVEKAIRNIVFWPSITQSVKGILTAGVMKSVQYSSSKLKKMFKSLL